MKLTNNSGARFEFVSPKEDLSSVNDNVDVHLLAYSYGRPTAPYLNGNNGNV